MPDTTMPDTTMPDDRNAIADLLLRYATAIDRRDWDQFRTCFTADVLAEYKDIGTWRGVDEITDFMAEVHAPMGPTLHRLSNIDVVVTGDTATARTYVDVVLTFDGGSGLNDIGFYDDDLVRTDDGWRIAHRRYTSVTSSQF